MKIERFDPPALWNDFADEPQQAQQLRETWSKNVNRWTESAIVGNPWSVLNDRDRDYYYNALITDIPEDAESALIPWFAFPNRILHAFPNVGQSEQWRYADEGPPAAGGQPYRPAGPRGWQDEYCEWSVTRNSAGQIVRVMFTCENPEYWFTLWQVSPERVLQLYRELVSPEVQMEDLYLRDAQSRPVIDRETGRPAYDAVNKWNSTTKNGAVHLISAPNTLGAEIYLAAAATLLREHDGDPITDQGALINCSRYGTPFRNSDPFIGSQVNTLVRTRGVRVALQNPVGLYIQQPDFSRYQLPLTAPPDTKIEDCWRIVRGSPGMGLHAVFEVPPKLGFTVSDISIDGSAIEFGSQIAQTFRIALTGQAIPSTLPPPVGTDCQQPNPAPLPSPLVLQDINLYSANSRSTAAPRVEQGTTVNTLLLLAADVKRGATVQFSGAGVAAKVIEFQPQEDGGTLMLLSVEVSQSAPVGDRALLLTNPDGAHGPAAPGMLEVVPACSLQTSPSLQSVASRRNSAEFKRDAAMHTPTQRQRRS